MPDKTTTAPAEVEAGAPSFDDGRTKFMALWLVLTGNPDFLISPAIQAQKDNSDEVTLVPGAAQNGTEDSIQDLDGLSTLLQQREDGTGEHANAQYFSTDALNHFLTKTLAQPLPPTMDSGQRSWEFSNGNTYADVLYNAALIFQDASSDFIPAVSWTPPCPNYIDEVPGLDS